jgi:hypothetical protein
MALALGMMLAPAAWAEPASEPPVRLNAGHSSEQTASDLAKKLQNPIGDLYSVPFQNNANFGVGPRSGAQNILNIQPVIPIHLNSEWNVITRTILPLVWPPAGLPGNNVAFGTGNAVFSAFLSPSTPRNGWLWGAGPVVQLPTASDATLGSSVWGAGPTGVLVYMKGPWVAGALANNIWSMGGTGGRDGTKYNLFTLQPFVNYNFGEGWYVGSSPIITANWLTTGDKAWTLPVGAQFGRVVRFGKLPANLLLGAYYNALRPEYGANWQLRSQVTFIF